MQKNIIGETIHYEEGARFWRKPNKNLIILLEQKDYKKITNKNFIWLNLTSNKKIKSDKRNYKSICQNNTFYDLK